MKHLDIKENEYYNSKTAKNYFTLDPFGFPMFTPDYFGNMSEPMLSPVGPIIMPRTYNNYSMSSYINSRYYPMGTNPRKNPYMPRPAGYGPMRRNPYMPGPRRPRMQTNPYMPRPSSPPPRYNPFMPSSTYNNPQGPSHNPFLPR